MDGRSEAGLPTGSRRPKGVVEILEWWRAYCRIEGGGARGLEVRDKVAGSNRYGVVPWDVPLAGEGTEAERQQQLTEAVSDGYTYQRRGTTRRKRARYVGDSEG